MDTNDFMHVNGFKNNDTSKTSNCTTQDLLNYMHLKGPHVVLDEFGMFNKKSYIPYKSIEYLNYYDITPKSVRYLMSILYEVELEVIDGKTKFLEKEDIRCTLPMYYLEIYDLSGNKIEQDNYSIEFTICETKISSEMIRFENGYLIDEHPENDYFCGSLEIANDIKNFLTNANCKYQCFMTNFYTDHVTITFNENVKIDKICVKCKTYNMFNYCGFFGSGWSYAI